MMRKNLLLVGALVGAFLFASCSGGSKSKEVSSVSTAEMENATEVIKYYSLSLATLKNVVVEKEVNAVLGYMEQQGKVPAIPAIAPPAISSKDSVALMHPGSYFNEATQANLKQNFAGLFESRMQFYANFDTYLSYLKAKDYANAKKLLEANVQLSTEMTEYKQNIFDILSPFTEQAEQILLADNPLKEQVMAVRKMSATMQSIVSLYVGKHMMDGTRIDMKTTELMAQLKAAKELPAVAGHEEDMKSFQAFLGQVDSFIKKVQQARQKGTYSAQDYDDLVSSYGIGII